MSEPTRRHALMGIGLIFVGACASSSHSDGPASFEPSRFQPWNADAPLYRLFPGDVAEITVHTATELSGPVTVGPDGRVTLPLAGAIMVADKTANEAARDIAQRYASVLRDPIVEVRPVEFADQQILVGGEVRNPGIFTLPSPRIGVLEALTLAGGATNRARQREIIVLRRAEDGGVMMRTVNLRAAQQGQNTDTIPLVRHDIVLAPSSTVAGINDFTELYIRNIIPLDNAFAFALTDQVFDNN